MNLLEVQSPGEIFSGDKNSLKSEFDKLVKKYHPDVNKSSNANEEFIHLQRLYLSAQYAINGDFWETKNTLRFANYRVKFFRKVDIDIGKMYVGDTHVTFIIDKNYEKLWSNAKSIINGFTYVSDKMKQEMSRFLPKIKTSLVLNDSYILVLEKTSDLILLRDIPIASIPNMDKHIAWIISSLYNILCYFEISGITHNDINLDTYFISPKYHSGVLLGGWWYSCHMGKKLLSVPISSYELFSHTMRKTKIANNELDKELLKALGRELLGDRGGTKLLSNKVAPMSFINWLRCSSSKSSIKEYALWDKVLEESYGPKKFIPMNLNAKDIYGGK